MYLRAAHAETHIPTLRAFIHANPLGLLTTALRSSRFPFLQSTHIPWVLDVQDEDSDEPIGVLRGHIARANPHCKALIEAMSGDSPSKGNGILKDEVMVMFTSPAQHYVTPQFYVSTKPATGKVVPTWDYAAVQAYGDAKIFHSASDPETDRFLTTQIADLTNLAESQMIELYASGSDATAWEVTDAPEKYLGLLKKSIVGIEINVTQLTGKWKMSQELSAGDREGVIKGFGQLNTDLGREIAETVEARGFKER